MNRLPQTTEPDNHTPEIHAHKVRRWADKEGQRRLAQLQRQLLEFREELLRGQASVLLSTSEQHKAELLAIFQNHMNAINLVSTILDISQSGVILSPAAWQVKREQN